MYMRIINYAHDSEKTLKIPPRALGIEGTWALTALQTPPLTRLSLAACRRVVLRSNSVIHHVAGTDQSEYRSTAKNGGQSL